jgi:hypothetical protein
VAGLLAACSPSAQPSAGTPTANPSSASTPAAARLVVTSTSSEQTKASVTIAEQSGHIIASTTFDAMPRPLIGNAGAVMPRQVIVAAGAAYYCDPGGRVHRFDASGTDTVVATFPITNKQQELSFAVSPDGKQIMATVLSTPPLHDPPPKSLADPLYQEGKPWTVETFLANAGGSTTSIARREGAEPVSDTRLVGWDSVGPVAVLDALIGAQNPPPSLIYSGSALVHIGQDGAHLDQIGGPSCHPLDRSAGGVLCYQGAYPRTYEVRTDAGALVWQQDLPRDSFHYNPVLSPDGLRIVTADGAVFSRDAQPASLARRMVSSLAAPSQGWLTSDLFAAGGADGKIVLVHPGDLQNSISTGLEGFFVGTL